MRYAITVDVAVPRDELVTLVDDSMVLPAWQEDLLRVEPLSGEPGLEDARTRLVYGVSGRELEIVETVTESRLPHGMTLLQCACGTCAEIRHEFEALGTEATRWTQHAQYSFTGPGVATFWSVMPGALPRRTRGQMLALKAYAEGRTRQAPPPALAMPPVA